jgi:hypothetical protein
VICNSMGLHNGTVGAESTTEWLLKLIVWEFFCTLTWDSRARSCVRKRRQDVTRWLRYWARTVGRQLDEVAFVIRWERRDRRVAALPYSDSAVSGTINQPKHMLRDEEHVEARDCARSSFRSLRGGRREKVYLQRALLVSGRLRGLQYIRAAQVQPGGLDLHQSWVPWADPQKRQRRQAAAQEW